MSVNLDKDSKTQQFLNLRAELDKMDREEDAITLRAIKILIGYPRTVDYRKPTRSASR